VDRLAGQVLQPAGPFEASRLGIVKVHQSTDVVGIPGLSVADALLLNQFADGRQPFFLSKAIIRQKASAILAEASFDLPLDRDFADVGSDFLDKWLALQLAVVSRQPSLLSV
jgi:simple sugar transport system ATP-binding protein